MPGSTTSIPTSARFPNMAPELLPACARRNACTRSGLRHLLLPRLGSRLLAPRRFAVVSPLLPAPIAN
eukprot:278863-Pyramimonas_sp.AAC.1